MKVKTPLLVVSLMVFLSGAGNSQTRGVEKQKYLNGAVQSMSIETGQLISLIGVGDSRPRVQSRERQLEYLFDDKGNLQESTRFTRGSVTQRNLFKYDQNGRLAEEARFESKNLLSERIAHRYNPEGRRIETLQYDETGKLTGRIVFGYDSVGSLVEKISYRDDKPNGRVVFAYDATGRESSLIAYDSKGDIPNQIISHYDDKANAVQRSRSGLKGDLEGTTVTTYDSKGNVTVILHHRPDGSAAWKWDFEYDDKGNVIKESFANKVSLSVWVSSYEYDSMGNWTTMSRSQLFEDRGKLRPFLQGVTYRTFKYYSNVNAIQPIPEPRDRGIVTDAALSMAATEVRPIRSGAALATSNSNESLGRPVHSGTLEVEMTIDTEGNVAAAKVLSGGDVFSSNPTEVEQKVKKRTYRPVLLNGVPVKVVDTMTLKYEVSRPGRGKW